MQSCEIFRINISFKYAKYFYCSWLLISHIFLISYLDYCISYIREASRLIFFFPHLLLLNNIVKFRYEVDAKYSSNALRNIFRYSTYKALSRNRGLQIGGWESSCLDISNSTILARPMAFPPSSSHDWSRCNNIISISGHSILLIINRELISRIWPRAFHPRSLLSSHVHHPPAAQSYSRLV